MLGRYISQQNGGDQTNQQKHSSDDELQRKLELMEATRQENHT